MAYGAIGYGHTVEIGRGATPTWSTMEGVGDLEYPKSETEEVETTHMGSADRTREYVSGLRDLGSFSLPLNHMPGSPTDTLLMALDASDEEVLIRITSPDLGTDYPSQVYTYVGWVRAYSRSTPVNGKMESTAEFRIIGKVNT